MKRSAVVLLVLAAVVSAFVLGSGRSAKPAAASPPPRDSEGVLVEGTGESSGAPDVLRLTLGINGTGADVTAALNSANAQIKRVHDVLRRDGVAEKDVQTSNVSIYPMTTKKGRRYEVSEQLVAALRDLHRAGGVISNAVAAGGSGISLDGVSFALEDNLALLDKARDKAFADAKQKAERYAGLSGARLGKVLLVSESVQSPRIPYAQEALGRDALPSASPVPVYGGESKIAVSVTVRWSFA